MPNETTNEDGVRGNVSRRNFFMRIGVAGAAAATTGPVPAAAQTPAMATEVSVDDRFRIQDVLRSYVWANDSGSVERVVAAFTPDGIVQPATGERIPVRRWASETFAQPGRRGRQHAGRWNREGRGRPAICWPSPRMPWRGLQRWRRVQQPLVEFACAENNAQDFLGFKVPIPQASKPDF